MRLWHVFGEDARKAIFHADDEARRRGAEAVDVDDIVCGCLKSGSPEARKILSSLGLEPEDLERDLLARPGRRGEADPGPLTLSSEGRQVVEDAGRARVEFDEAIVGVQHLLLAAAQQECQLSRALAARRRTHLDLASAIVRFRLGEATPLADFVEAHAPLDLLTLLLIREERRETSVPERIALEKLAAAVATEMRDRRSDTGKNALAETFADAVNLAAERREPLGAVHLLAAIFRREGTALSAVAPHFYENPESMLDRLVGTG